MELKENLWIYFVKRKTQNAKLFCKTQGPSLRRLLFLIYINDSSDNLSSNCKLFEGDTSLFYVVHDATISFFELNSDLVKISEWTFKRKVLMLTQLSQLKK